MGGSAAAIWEALPVHDEEPIAVTALIAQLVDRFQTSPAVVERDTAVVLDALEAVGCAVRLP